MVLFCNHISISNSSREARKKDCKSDYRFTSAYLRFTSSLYGLLRSTVTVVTAKRNTCISLKLHFSLSVNVLATALYADAASTWNANSSVRIFSTPANGSQIFFDIYCMNGKREMKKMYSNNFCWIWIVHVESG